MQDNWHNDKSTVFYHNLRLTPTPHNFSMILGSSAFRKLADTILVTDLNDKKTNTQLPNKSNLNISLDSAILH